MEQTMNYDNLIPLQGRKLKDINIHEIVDAVIKAGEAEDYRNATISLKDDDDRLGENYASFAYEMSDGNELVNIDTKHGHYSVPVIDGQINYRNVDRRLNRVLKDFGEKEIYIDMPYINEEEPVFEADVSEVGEDTYDFVETDSDELQFISDLVREQFTEIQEYGTSAMDSFDVFLKFASNSPFDVGFLDAFQDDTTQKAEITDISADRIRFTHNGFNYVMDADGSIYEMLNEEEKYVATANIEYLTQEGQFVSNLGKIKDKLEPEQTQENVDIKDANKSAPTEELQINKDLKPEIENREEPYPVVINRKRTQLESEVSIDLKDTAERLRKKGYEVRTKQGGSLFVTDPNLSKENSITITKKNAYIEAANLTTPEAETMYNRMKEVVMDTMQESLDVVQKCYDMIEISPKLGEVPAQIVVTSMIYQFNLDKMSKEPDYADVFSEPERKYLFKDKNGKEYMSISMGYSVEESEKSGLDKSVKPVIVAKYGPDYGDISRLFHVSEKDIEAFAKNQGYKSDVAKDVNEFVAIGTKSRESVFKEIQINRYEKQIDKVFSAEFKKLNPEKSKFFSNKAKEYFRMDIGKQGISLTDHMLNELPKAPFFRESMQNHEESFRKMFDGIEKKLDPPDLSGLKLETISMDQLDYTIEENGIKTFDSTIREPVVYDREWITKLVNIVDKLNDIKNGPVQDMIDTAKSMARGVNEARQGAVKIYKDGIYSGFEFGSGIQSFGEGLTYGHVLHNLEKEYTELAKSDDKNDQLAAIDKKMDIKIYRDEIMRNADVYAKAAVVIRDNVDKMIDAVQSLKIQGEISEKGEKPFMNSRFIDQVNEYFKRLGNDINENFKKIIHSINEINKNVMAFGVKRINMVPEAFHTVQAKTSYSLSCFRKGYNEAVINAKVNLSSKEYSKNQIAKTLNDARLLQACRVESNELSNAMQGRLWDELDNSIRKGHEAEIIAPEDRSSMETLAVNYGKQAKQQKEQNLFIAERLNDKIKDVILREEKMTMPKAAEVLAAEYHNAAMAYSVMNGASTMKTYANLSDAEKAECQDVIRTVLENMPNVKDKLDYNMEQIDRNSQEMRKTSLRNEPLLHNDGAI